MTIEDIYKAFSRLSVLVVGDICLDRDAVCSYTGRLSREVEAQPVLVIDREWWRPGGGGNLAANLANIGLTTYVVGTWGNRMDRNRLTLEAELTRKGISTTGMVVAGRTPTYEKFYLHNGSQVHRIDLSTVAHSSWGALVSSISRIAEVVDYCIVADYDEEGCGTCGPQVMEAVRDLSIPTFGTSRTRAAALHGLDWIVINRAELRGQFGGDPGEVLRAASKCAITHGEEGATMYLPAPISLPSYTPPGEVVRDICGCGDTFLAIFSAARVAGMEDALALAIVGAGITATKACGTGYPSKYEMGINIGG